MAQTIRRDTGDDPPAGIPLLCVPALPSCAAIEAHPLSSTAV